MNMTWTRNLIRLRVIPFVVKQTKLCLGSTSGEILALPFSCLSVGSLSPGTWPTQNCLSLVESTSSETLSMTWSITPPNSPVCNHGYGNGYPNASFSVSASIFDGEWIWWLGRRIHIELRHHFRLSRNEIGPQWLANFRNFQKPTLSL